VTERPESPDEVTRSLKTAGIWLLGHAPRFVPVLVLGVVVALTWQALGDVHPRVVMGQLREMDGWWLAAALAVTFVNIGVMGCYDVVAFAHTRARALQRWRYGAVAFAWSNFLTLGPFAGPAIRFWLYRGDVDHGSDLETGILSVTIAFASGLAGWTAAALVVPADGILPHAVALAVLAWAVAYALTLSARRAALRFERFNELNPGARAALGPSLVGWLDWGLASVAFIACLRATGNPVPALSSIRSFFFGQAIGLASLIPGGFGSSDAFWIAHLALPAGVSAAALVAYRLIYYILPWAAASLVLLSWATRRFSRHVELARRLVAGLVAAGGVLILLSTASPMLHARLALVEQVVPLPVVEVGHLAAAFTGVLLLVLARGLAKGYRAALGATILVLILAAVSALLKGLDYEEALILGGLAAAAWSQTPLFDRVARGAWFTGRDLALVTLALVAFLAFGAFTHRITPSTLGRIREFGYRVERGRYLRTAGTLALAVAAGAFYVLLRPPVRFRRLGQEEIDRALELHASIGSDTSAMMVANADKAVFWFADRGFCLYRTIGPYVVVFGDPAVQNLDERNELLAALFTWATEIDRRPLFYQVSLEWIPPLHDRGYAFFKLGEEAHVPIERVTLEGHHGKMYRQVLRRGERDHLRLRVLPPFEVQAVLPELRAISDEWLAAKGQRERQFSIGSFDEQYMQRFPCAIVEELGSDGTRTRILAFANLLRGPHRGELSVDLMRYREEGPGVMDFLIVSLLLYGKEQGFKRFNLGMAPLASVGEFRGAHARERLANLLFQYGENFYNFQGLRLFKQKFDPDWVPRYLAYPNAWEWPAAVTNVSALIAGGWANVIRPGRVVVPAASERRSSPDSPPQEPAVR
jgi:phosphatidylglycerol lysyltransferase